MRMVARPRKTPTNLSIREDLVRDAKALGLNLSELVEDAIETAVREARGASWLAENQEAIADYNAFVGKHGSFSDGRRRF